ncbi:MAG: pyridoxal 5'-phosphate synthase [Woeseiaceae bacterium]|nr:pyridoxal 5'-phosphate synthase [Woeseiaceae bacterium]
MTESHPQDRLPERLPADPAATAFDWFVAAQQSSGQRNPNSMTLVTVDGDGRPAARIVLCKEFVADPGYLVFYTNYTSDKGRQLAANPRVACVLHWDSLGRQIRAEGIAVKSPPAESDAYFASRGWGSQLGAWGSDQSQPLASRAALIRQIRERAAGLGIELGEDTDTLATDSPPVIERPPHWGGYRVWFDALELWVEGSDRIHDRARYTRELTAVGDTEFTTGRWSGARLQP